MNKELEKRKKMFELSRVKLAREELELKIIEREDEISRLKAAIDKQVEKETELQLELNKL